MKSLLESLPCASALSRFVRLEIVIVLIVGSEGKSRCYWRTYSTESRVTLPTIAGEQFAEDMSVNGRGRMVEDATKVLTLKSIRLIVDNIISNVLNFGMLKKLQFWTSAISMFVNNPYTWRFCAH